MVHKQQAGTSSPSRAQGVCPSTQLPTSHARRSLFDLNPDPSHTAHIDHEVVVAEVVHVVFAHFCKLDVVDDTFSHSDRGRNA